MRKPRSTRTGRPPTAPAADAALGAPRGVAGLARAHQPPGPAAVDARVPRRTGRGGRPARRRHSGDRAIRLASPRLGRAPRTRIRAARAARGGAPPASVELALPGSAGTWTTQGSRASVVERSLATAAGPHDRRHGPAGRRSAAALAVAEAALHLRRASTPPRTRPASTTRGCTCAGSAPAGAAARPRARSA